MTKKTTKRAVAVFSEGGRKFFLRSKQMVEAARLPYSLVKSDLRAVLGIGGGRGTVPYAIGAPGEDSFRAGVTASHWRLGIGCQSFNRDEAKKIYRWVRIKFPF